MVITPSEYNHVDSFKNGLAGVVTKDGKARLHRPDWKVCMGARIAGHGLRTLHDYAFIKRIDKISSASEIPRMMIRRILCSEM
jgi:hypothetical protein